MQNFDRLKNNYMRMDQRARREILALSTVLADKHPCGEPAAPSVPLRWYRWLLHQLRY